MSAFTITVIALDRWQSVTNTHPSDTLTYTKVGLVITAIWAISFACKFLLFIFSDLCHENTCSLKDNLYPNS